MAKEKKESRTIETTDEVPSISDHDDDDNDTGELLTKESIVSASDDFSLNASKKRKAKNEGFTPPSEDIHAGVGLTHHPPNLGYNLIYRKGYQQESLAEAASNEAQRVITNQNANENGNDGFYKQQAYRLVPWLKKAQYDPQEWSNIKSEFMRFYERTGTAKDLNDKELENKIVNSLSSVYKDQFSDWRSHMRLQDDDKFEKWWSTLGGEAKLMDDGTVVMPNGWKVVVNGTIFTPSDSEATPNDLEVFFEHLSNEQLEDYWDPEDDYEDDQDGYEDGSQDYYSNEYETGSKKRKHQITLYDCITGTHEKNEDINWFTNKFDKERTFESHASYINDYVDQLTMQNINAAKFQQLCQIEDQLHAKLSDMSINDRKWTFRFVSKRMKPKIINFLHRERLELLQLYLDDDWDQWKIKENVYTSIGLLPKFEFVAANIWKQLLLSYQHHTLSIERYLVPFRIEYGKELELLAPTNNVGHLLLINEALNLIFPKPTSFIKHKNVILLNPINSRNAKMEQANRKKRSNWYKKLQKQRRKEDEEEEEEDYEETESTDMDSLHSFLIDEFDEDEAKYPNVGQIEMLIKSISVGMERIHRKKLWDYHERVYNYDEDCELGLSKALQLFSHISFEDFQFTLTKVSDFDQWVESMINGETPQELGMISDGKTISAVDTATMNRHSGYNNGTNPLRSAEIVNFHHILKAIIENRHQGNHFRRLICSMFPSLLPDWEATYLRSTQVILGSQVQWLEHTRYNFDDESCTISAEAWTEIQQTLQEKDSNSKDRTFLTYDKDQILPDMVADVDTLIEDEVPEIDRLMKRQILISDYDKFLFLTIDLKVFQHTNFLFNQNDGHNIANAFQHIDMDLMLYGPKIADTPSLTSKIADNVLGLFSGTKQPRSSKNENKNENEMFMQKVTKISDLMTYDSKYNKVSLKQSSAQSENNHDLETQFETMMEYVQSHELEPIDVQVTATTQDQLIIFANDSHVQDVDLHQGIEKEKLLLLVDLKLCDKIHFMYDKTEQILIKQGNQMICLISKEHGFLKVWENALTRL